MFPDVDSYEVMPWPERVFGHINADYGTEIQSVIAALQDMPSGLPSVRRIVVLGDDATACADARAVSFAAWIEGTVSEDPGHVGGPDEVSMQLYTSGTTGLPKGVLLDTPEHIATFAPALRVQAVLTHAMPPNNLTEMTPQERAILEDWLGDHGRAVTKSAQN